MKTIKTFEGFCLIKEGVDETDNIKKKGGQWVISPLEKKPIEIKGLLAPNGKTIKAQFELDKETNVKNLEERNNTPEREKVLIEKGWTKVWSENNYALYQRVVSKSMVAVDDRGPGCSNTVGNKYREANPEIYKEQR
jgi:hypothetical protein